jgi:hypothetical protein
LPIYAFSQPNNLRGIGGLAGPKVSRDTVVTTRFTSKIGLTASFLIRCGVVPDGIFPGDLTLGKSVFHKWRLAFDGDISLAQRETARLRSFEDKPTQIPYDRVPKSYFAHTAIKARKTVGEDAFATNYNDVLAMKWGKGTPLEDPKIRAYLKSCIKEFTGFFDPAKQRTNILTKTEHTIDTGDETPVKLPPRHYNLAQLRAI